MMKNEDLQKALEAAELGSEQYPFSSSLLIKKQIFYYPQALP
jgi:hypothetical protein